MTVESFAAAGNYIWTCPSGVTQVTVLAIGGGGGGRSGQTASASGRGGGGGASAYGTVSVTPGNQYTVTVGAGGSADGGNGGTSRFTGDGGAKVEAVGGTAGATGIGSGGAGGSAALCTGNLGTFNGGQGGSSVSASSNNREGGAGGGSGGSGQAGSAGENAAAADNGSNGGNGGIEGGGRGGNGGTSGGDTATVGTGPGAGGGGGGAGPFVGRPGKNGTDGLVRLEYVLPNEVLLQPDQSAGKDAEIASNQSSTSTSHNLAIGRVGDTGTVELRLLLQFDLSGIPAGAEILSATLSLVMTTDSSDQTRTIEVRRIKRPWVEAEVNWIRAQVGTNWQTAGATGSNDSESTAIGSLSLSSFPLPNQFREWSLDTTAIKEMIAGGSFGNQGFLLIMSVEENDFYNFVLSSHSIASARPKLSVVYLLPGGGRGVGRGVYRGVLRGVR